MEAASHTVASTQSETESISSATMDMRFMVAHMQRASIAGRTNEHTGLASHQSANVSYSEL
jgi:polyisoprenoid-binding protein YceI